MGVNRETPSYSPEFAIKTAPTLEEFSGDDYLEVYEELGEIAQEFGIFISPTAIKAVLQEIKENFTAEERRYLPRWYQAAKEALLKNGLSKKLVYTGLVEWLGDPTHGAVHSLYVLTAALHYGTAVNSREALELESAAHDFAFVINAPFEALTTAHDMGRATPLEIGEDSNETERSIKLRHLRHAEVGAAMVYLLSERFGLSREDRRRLYYDVRFHDYVIEQTTRGEVGKIPHLTSEGQLMHDMEKLWAAGGKTPEKAVERYIRRARTMARTRKPGEGWYFMRSDLGLKDYLKWKMGLRGFSDNLAGMLPLQKWKEKDFFTDFGKNSLRKWQAHLLPAILEVVGEEKDWLDEVVEGELFLSLDGRQVVSPSEVRETLGQLQDTVIGCDKEYGEAYGLGLYTMEGKYVDPTIALPTKKALLQEVKRRFEEYKGHL